MMPQTLLAFIGASGRSVKIVCRGELFGGGLPVEEEDIKRFHLIYMRKPAWCTMPSSAFARPHIIKP